MFLFAFIDIAYLKILFAPFKADNSYQND